jgi:ABC-2 type transport system ATP-binding protein
MPFDVLGEKENSYIVRIHPDSAPNDVLKYFLQQNANIQSFNEILPSLNEIFIKLVEGTSVSRQFLRSGAVEEKLKV